MEKFLNYDFKRLKTDDLVSIEECAYAMAELDKIIASIDTQLLDAAADLRENGVYADSEWFAAAKRAIKSARICRQMAQEKRGAIAREERKRNALRIEKLFIDAAMILLTKEQISAIWDEAHRLGRAEDGKQAG